MAKKDFKKDNPALTFISNTEEVAEAPEVTNKTTEQLRKEAPEGYKVNPLYVEVKSKRVQLVLQPSVVDAIKALAKKKGLSMNEAINEAIQAYLKKR